ncbi:hypothetical protein GCM10017744_102690 [Streptomyces antimycoticus]|uniref:Uncharacterized protein n=1 Tax=Streptomyces antimycoticus TaxID=68175 RepID=A0A4D4KTX6_9ACTN|nr:hypothetical protein [Streptomyces antimycoticus]GDY49303.1 hypothetical protein SANT12839_101850 [Streptomyces antimycoticus]
MFRRRNYTTTTPAPGPTPAASRPEIIAITLNELETVERVLLHADERKRLRRPDLGPSGHTTRLLAALYQRAGAASVVQPSRQLARIPFYASDFLWLELAIEDIELYGGRPVIARDGRHLLNRFNALLGQARAITHMGGTPVFDPDTALPGPTTDS